MHAGSPENFTYQSTVGYDNRRVEYILSGEIRQTEYNKLSNGIVINGRDWSMYADKSLKAKGYIDEIHEMTYDEALAVTESTNNTGGLRKTNGNYWLASSCPDDNVWSVWYIRFEGSFSGNNCYCWGIRPVISLTYGVYIASGDGTEGNEYVLSKD